MKKKLFIFGILILLLPSVLADYGDMMGYGMMYGVGGGMWYYGILWFILAAFVFAVIFWLTYKLIMQDKMNKKK